jgi:hypothetical protein
VCRSGLRRFLDGGLGVLVEHVVDADGVDWRSGRRASRTR